MVEVPISGAEKKYSCQILRLLAPTLKRNPITHSSLGSGLKYGVVPHFAATRWSTLYTKPDSADQIKGQLNTAGASVIANILVPCSSYS